MIFRGITRLYGFTEHFREFAYLDILGNLNCFDNSTNFFKTVGSSHIRSVRTAVTILWHYNTLKLFSFREQKYWQSSVFVGAFVNFLSGNADKIFLAGGAKELNGLFKIYARHLYLYFQWINEGRKESRNYVGFTR